jgi:hypothetical protein
MPHLSPAGRGRFENGECLLYRLWEEKRKPLTTGRGEDRKRIIPSLAGSVGFRNVE